MPHDTLTDVCRELRRLLENPSPMALVSARTPLIRLTHEIEVLAKRIAALEAGR